MRLDGDDEDDGGGSPDNNVLLFTGHSPRSGRTAFKISSVQSLCLQNSSGIENKDSQYGT